MTPVIDVHVHIYPPRRLGGLMRWAHRGMPGHPVPVDIAAERVVTDLREAGVERFLSAVFPLVPGEAAELNRFHAAFARNVPEMVPLGTVHQDDPNPGAVAREALLTLGLKGIKLHPMMTGTAINDPRLAPVYALAQESGLPLLVHTGFEEGHGRRIPRDEWERFFRAWPRLAVLCAHMFFPDLPYAFSLLPRFENVHLDMTNVLGMMKWPPGPLPFGIPRPSWGMEELLSAIEAHAGRVLFGSDHPAGIGTVADQVALVRGCGLGEEAVGRVLCGNARKLFASLGRA